MGKNLKGREIGTGIRQRADGRYEARATINGQKISLYDMSLSTLKKRFEEMKDEAQNKLKTPYPKEMTLNQWYEIWFTQCKSPQLKSEMSRTTYERKFRNTFCKLLGEKKLEDISHMNIQMAANDLADEYSYKSVREAIGVFREMLDVAEANGLIDHNPCISIKVRNSNELQKERRFLDHWEQDLLFEEIDGCFYEEVYKILLLTGMRIGEFSGLWWEDVDFSRRVIHIRRSMEVGYVNGVKVEKLTTPKTSNAYRDIPFFGETEQLFRSWRLKQKKCKEKLGTRWRLKPKFGDLVFTSSMGSPLNRYVLSHDINKVVKNMQLRENDRARKENRMPRPIKGVYPHAFRHTFATRCFEKEMDPVVVQKIMGHTNYATTVSYTHVTSDLRDKEALKIGNFFD